jgi:hypothetical protein
MAKRRNKLLSRKQRLSNRNLKNYKSKDKDKEK